MSLQHNLEKHEVDQLLKSQIYGINYDLAQSESMNSSNLNDSHEEEFGSHFLAMPQVVLLWVARQYANLDSCRSAVAFCFESFFCAA